MPVPQQDIVQPILDKYHQPILAVVRGAWDDWRSSPLCGIWRFRRSRANFVWEQIIERAHFAFASDPGVQIRTLRETCNFIVDDQVLFRFKKGDQSGRSANVPTQLALAFHDHGQNLFGLPDIHRVEVVYKLNSLETQISDVHVVGRDEDVILWSYSLLPSAAAVVPLPAPSHSASPPATAQRLVRPRRASQMPNPSKQN